MDNPIPRPAGLAILITTAIALLTPGAMEQAGPAHGRWLQAYSPAKPPVSAELPMLATQPKPTEQRVSAEQPVSTKKQQLWSGDRDSELLKELPVDIRTARLMLSVESLFEATTTN